MKIANNIIMLSLIISIAGCSIRTPYYINGEDNEALNILKKIESINKDIKTSKGTGWITITDIELSDEDINSSSNNNTTELNINKQRVNRQKSKKFRMAWIASFPDKIRLTLLSAGHPVETILADGNSVTFISHTGRHKTKKISSANPSLKDVVSIPVTIQDILSIFAGRTPISKFDTAEIAQITYSSELTDNMLMLKRRWNGQSQNIVLNSDHKVTSFLLMNQNRKLIHSVFNEQFKVFDSFSIPVNVKIKDGDGRLIDFEINNYQPNIAVKANTFILQESSD
ncbi:MAG: hypothetical protein HQK69_00870 [Desulfamplus sp.]|nr:hypothetical protein [Desulfamplus sp.]